MTFHGRLFIAALLCGLAAVCSQAQGPANSRDVAPVEPKAPKMFDISAIDKSVDPCVNFYSAEFRRIRKGVWLQGGTADDAGEILPGVVAGSGPTEMTLEKGERVLSPLQSQQSLEEGNVNEVEAMGANSPAGWSFSSARVGHAVVHGLQSGLFVCNVGTV
jgi:hypothetical protein